MLFLSSSIHRRFPALAGNSSVRPSRRFFCVQTGDSPNMTHGLLKVQIGAVAEKGVGKSPPSSIAIPCMWSHKAVQEGQELLVAPASTSAPSAPTTTPSGTAGKGKGKRKH